MDRDQCGWRHVEDPEVGSVELRPALPRVPPSRMALERLAGTGWGGLHHEHNMGHPGAFSGAKLEQRKGRTDERPG